MLVYLWQIWYSRFSTTRMFLTSNSSLYLLILETLLNVPKYTLARHVYLINEWDLLNYNNRLQNMLKETQNVIL